MSAQPTTPESLHWAICQAVMILNSCPDADACRANTILRTALAEYFEPPKTPEARAGDCDHSDEWLATELEKLSADMEPGMPSWALLIWSASAIRRLTTKATP